MIFKRFEIPIWWRIILAVLALSLLILFVYTAWLLLIVLPVFIFIFLIWDYCHQLNKVKIEMQDFLEAIKYRDFTRNYQVKNAPKGIQFMREGFNAINAHFKHIRKEKETQFIYLKSILELIDTGILSYEVESGEVLWANEALKRLLQTPYLKNIQLLEKKNEIVYMAITKLATQQTTICNVVQDYTQLKILISATLFESEGKLYKLIAFQNINKELDTEEAEAWQKLLRVMTHELMNSVAPISSLAELLKLKLQQAPDKNDLLNDLELGITTIKDRSESLMKFTETYRHLSKLNTVTKSTIFVSEVFEQVEYLFQPKFNQLNIEFEIVLKDLFINVFADKVMVEQMIINLTLNAIDAVKNCEKPVIQLRCEAVKNKVIIKIEDNGVGIEEDDLDKIFVPFYSNKKNGTGIGLSLCKQIMVLHKGQISVKSIINQGTVFTLVFEQDTA